MMSKHYKELEEYRMDYQKLQNAYDHLESEFRIAFNSIFRFLNNIGEKDKLNKSMEVNLELQNAYQMQQQVFFLDNNYRIFSIVKGMRKNILQ